jgi:hypothetical protein
MEAQTSLVANPFGMLVDPQAVERALAGSQRLECLNRRICRPLDRVTIPGDRAHEVDALDREDAADSRH